MRITSRTPDTWEDLQLKVGEILKNCGFNVEIEKKINTARGEVEVDVYAEEEINGRKYSIICECKHWKNNIPQNVIHSLRSVVDDSGCNIGYAITTSKFQSGSLKAVQNTNVVLLTWENFQDTFFESWYAKHFYQVINKELSMLFDYTIVPWFDDLTQEDRKKYNQIKNILLEIDEIKSYFPLPFLKDIGISDYGIPKLPLKGNMFNIEDYYGDLPDTIMSENYYQELLEKIIPFGKKAISDFLELEVKYSAKGEL